ncbi:hypothetical protein [Parvularcula marina]|uniref:hypothetical protein n=1 Tax=Parvularcula marina TaxID=2292771 RepID=UPI00351570EB
MTNLLFYMYEYRRKHTIAKHNFYVEQGKIRLTDQFSDQEKIAQEASRYAEEFLENASRHFDPDRHDPSDFYDQAIEEERDFHIALDSLGNAARLALISGMFHAWDKELRSWLTSNDGIGYWYRGEELPKAIWRVNFHEIIKLFECAGLFPKGDPILRKLDLCRLVVNTYKHGSGSSENDLKDLYPEFFDQYGFRSKSPDILKFTNYEDLYVKPEHIDLFSEAVIAFWNLVPDHITTEDLTYIPEWFDSAVKRDKKKAGAA